MNNIISFHDEAAKRCVEIGERIGEGMAKNIMNAVMLHGHSVEKMDDMVRESMALARKTFIDLGACENDTEVICDVIYRALVRKGKEIATLAEWEGGHA